MSTPIVLDDEKEAKRTNKRQDRDGNFIYEGYVLNAYKPLPREFLTNKLGTDKKYIPIATYRGIMKEINRFFRSQFGLDVF